MPSPATRSLGFRVIFVEAKLFFWMNKNTRKRSFTLDLGVRFATVREANAKTRREEKTGRGHTTRVRVWLIT